MTDTDQPIPMFTVLMPVYNHAAYVPEAIRSVREQTFAGWELLVVDDGSTDSSAALVDDLAGADERITALHQANAGPAAARNTALEQARAKWLTYIDSDDVWYPDTLQAYADHITAHRDARFIYGYRDRLDEDGSITELEGEYQDGVTGTAELWERMYLSHLCVCYRRKLLDVAGGYDAELRTCEDYELYLRLSLHCRFEPLGRPTGLRRRHGGNISRQTGRTRMTEAEVLRRFVERQGGADVLEPDRIVRRLGRLYYTAARQYFRAGCFRQAAAAGALAHCYRRTLKSTLVSLASNCLRFIGRTDGAPLPRL